MKNLKIKKKMFFSDFSINFLFFHQKFFFFFSLYGQGRGKCWVQNNSLKLIKFHFHQIQGIF